MTKRYPKIKYWNYRIVKDTDSFSIREVYYNMKDKPISWTRDADFLWTDEPTQIKQILTDMLACTEKPILEIKHDGDKEWLEEYTQS